MLLLQLFIIISSRAHLLQLHLLRCGSKQGHLVMACSISSAAVPPACSKRSASRQEFSVQDDKCLLSCLRGMAPVCTCSLIARCTPASSST